MANTSSIPVDYLNYFCAVFFSFIGVLRSQELKSLKTYENSLVQFYRLQRTVEREECKDFKEKPIWRYPSDVEWQFSLSSIQFWLSKTITSSTPVSYLVFFCAVFFSFIGVLQSQELKSLKTYENSLVQFYRLQRTAEREEFKDFKEKPIWRYLPDVGLQFGLPSVQFRLSNYFEYKRDQHLIKSKLRGIDAKVQLKMNEKIQDLRIAFRKLELSLDKLKLGRGKLIYLKRLHAIDQECCRTENCTPGQCHRFDLNYYQATEAIKLKEMDYKIDVLELERMAKYELPTYDFVR